MEGQKELRAPYARHMRGLLRGYARHMRALCLPARAKMRAAPVNFFNLPPIIESLRTGRLRSLKHYTRKRRGTKSARKIGKAGEEKERENRSETGREARGRASGGRGQSKRRQRPDRAYGLIHSLNHPVGEL